MSHLSVPNLESDAGLSGQIYAQIKKAIGRVPKTFAAVAALGPPPSSRCSPPMQCSSRAP
jgi:hypothetical protein